MTAAQYILCATILAIFSYSSKQNVASLQSPVLNLNRSLHISISSKRNLTGHWISLFSLNKTATRLPTRWDADFSLNTFGNDSVQSLHAVGKYVEPPQDETTKVPERYHLLLGGSAYKFYNSTPLAFFEAVYNCSFDGGHLAIINSEEEASFIRELWKKQPTGGSFSYLGFSDLAKEGEHRTVFGGLLSESGYLKWGPSEPSAKRACGFFDEKALLRTMSCDNKRPFLCEYNLKNN